MYSVRKGAPCVRAADGMRKSASGPDRKTMSLHISKGWGVNSHSINFNEISVKMGFFPFYIVFSEFFNNISLCGTSTAVFDIKSQLSFFN